jgi:thymidylate synthase
MELSVMNVNEALAEGLHWLRSSGVREESRNGPVLVSPEPVLTTYKFPMERVLFSPVRDANPFFHLMEALWMLAGRNDLAWPLFFNSKFGAFSDDGNSVHGAYGFRWRDAMGYDQLKAIGQELRKNPTSRRMVLQMWDAQCYENNDLNIAIQGVPHKLDETKTWDKSGVRYEPSKDVPCNTHVYFDVKDGVLNQTVCCRSNDIIWGAYGANAVHFSVLLEYMAALAGVGVGLYRQFSNNYHMYPALYQKEGRSVDDAMVNLAMDADINDLYKNLDLEVKQSPLINTPVAEWDAELRHFLNNPMGGQRTYTDPFFEQCAIPMYQAWFIRKNKLGNGLAELEPMKELYTDWYIACKQWIERREARKGPNSCGDCGKVVCACHRVI